MMASKENAGSFIFIFYNFCVCFFLKGVGGVYSPLALLLK